MQVNPIGPALGVELPIKNGVVTSDLISFCCGGVLYCYVFFFFFFFYFLFSFVDGIEPPQDAVICGGLINVPATCMAPLGSTCAPPWIVFAGELKILVRVNTAHGFKIFP